MRKGRSAARDAASARRSAALAARHAWQATQVGPNAIVCRLCGREFRAISCTHLVRMHQYDRVHPVEEYKRQFGLEVAVCRDTHRTMRRTREDFWERHGQRWTRARVVEVLQGRARDGQSLGSRHLGVPLGLAIRRRFGSWDRAMRRAGLDPRAHRLKHRLRSRWNRARIVEEVRRLHVPGERLTATHVKRAAPELHGAAIRILGNWSAALRAAGFDPAENREPTKWELARAEAWVRKAHAKGRSILASRVPSGLVGGVARKTGMAWVEFVESLGIPYTGQRKRLDWSDAVVVAEIRDRRRRGLALSNRAVRVDREALVQQACKRFGSWDAALRAAGVDPATVRLARRWTPESVLAAIRELHASGQPLDRRSVAARDSGLVQAAQNRFGDRWERAVEAAGFDPALAHTHRTR